MYEMVTAEHCPGFPPGMPAGENPIYSFLRLEPNYVLHINTIFFFAQLFPYTFNYPKTNLWWELGMDLLCSYQNFSQS